MPVAAPKKKYHELADYLRDRIRKGELKVGERLPTYSELYDELGASTATIQRACDLLHQEKLIERRHGSGIFVAPTQPVRCGAIGIIGSAGFSSEEGPFISRVMRAVHRAVENEGRQLVYLGPETSWYLSPSVQVEGVLICGVEETAPTLSELPADLPRVSVFTSLEGATSVGVDEYRAGQTAARHLLDLGHTKIACLMEKQAWEGRRRVGGYADALQERGIEPDPRWKRMVPAVNLKSPLPYWNWAQEQMNQWLEEDWQELGCTAILVQNDMAAVALVRVLQEKGIRVPEDVSIMGFDGTEICDMISPRITSIALPLTEIGETAMDVLNRQIENRNATTQTILLPVRIRHGESAAAPPGRC